METETKTFESNLGPIVVQESSLSEKQKQDIEELGNECFADVDQQSIEEDFIAESYGRVLAYRDDKLIGMLSLYKRTLDFEGQSIIVGGMGGVCVTSIERGKGLATSMLKIGLDDLRERGCDVACLNVDLEKQAYKVYEKLGFKIMDREISFENINGETINEKGTMFIPIQSPSLFHLIMNSAETFHYGKGYW